MAEAKKLVTTKTKKTTDKVVKKPAVKAVKKVTAKKASEVTTKNIAKKAIKFVDAEKPVETPVETIPKSKANDSPSEPLAKAGKRSTKAIKEVEAKAEKEERKAHLAEEKAAEEPIAKTKAIQVRTHLERQGKKLQTASKLIEKGKSYSVKEACDLVVKTSPVKFDATVELHIRLGVDPKLADQNIRANIVLPSGTGKVLKVAVIAELDKVDLAKKAGADIAGSDEFLQQLEKQLINFDVLIATPTMMPKLGKYAKLLGPKGLMPNPKSGTVTVNVAKAVKEAKGGKIEYRIDSNGIVHLGIGKISFGADKLLDNVTTVLNSIKNSRPASVKSTYVLSVFITSSMGPSIKISTSEI